MAGALVALVALAALAAATVHLEAGVAAKAGRAAAAATATAVATVELMEEAEESAAPAVGVGGAHNEMQGMVCDGKGAPPCSKPCGRVCPCHLVLQRAASTTLGHDVECHLLSPGCSCSLLPAP